MQTNFGFIMEEASFAWNNGQIHPLPDHAARVETIATSGRVCGGWYFPPLVSADGSPPAGCSHPQVSARSFSLMSSHQLILSGGPQGDKFAQFLIAFVGLLQGLRLIPEGWQHFYRTPVQRGTMTF